MAAYPPAPTTMCDEPCGQDIAEVIDQGACWRVSGRALAGWGRRFRIAMQGVVRARVAIDLAPVSGASRRRRVERGRWLAGGGEMQAAGSVNFGSIEVTEVRFPLFFRHHEFGPDSFGDGSFRGGPGRAFSLSGRNEAGSDCQHGRRRGAPCPYGFFGGKDGLPHRYRLHRAGGAKRVLRPRSRRSHTAGRSCSRSNRAGGGGWGPPASDPAARAADVRTASSAPAPTPSRDGSLRCSVRLGADDMYRIGIDVGGTFTDLVAVDAAGASTLAKAPRRPQIPPTGVLDGLALLAAELGLDLADLLARTERIVHGTTVATNALLERKGARSACSPPRAIATLSRCARASRTIATTCACRRPCLWCRARAAWACASACASTARSNAARRRSLDRAIDALAHGRRRGGRRLLSARLPEPRARKGHGASACARAAGRLRVALVGGAAADQGIRAGLDDGGQRLRRPGAGALPRAASPRELQSGRLSRATC